MAKRKVEPCIFLHAIISNLKEVADTMKALAGLEYDKDGVQKGVLLAKKQLDTKIEVLQKEIDAFNDAYYEEE